MIQVMTEIAKIVSQFAGALAFLTIPIKSEHRIRIEFIDPISKA